MTTIEELSTISLDILLEYHKAGFKLIPLSKDAKTPNVMNILTSEEEDRSRKESLDGQVHPVNYISNHPEFWTENRIKHEQWRFNNVATTFGKTHLIDGHDAALYLNALDIDSKQVFDSLAIIRFDDKDRYFIDEMCKITSVTQTRKKWGRHIYWLSHEQHQPIRTKDCKPGYEFEIKTNNSTGLSTLPDSVHRDDANFHYQSIGNNVLSIQDSLYDGLVKELADCLRQSRTRIELSKSIDNSHVNNIISDNTKISLTETDIIDMAAQLNQYYQKGLRHDFAYGLSGYLYKNKVNLESAENVIKLICQSTNDEELNSRITVLHNTYRNGDANAPISGYSSLKDVVTRVSDEQNAHFVLDALSRSFSKYRNPILSQLDNTITQELSKHYFEVVCYSPIGFVIAHSDKKQILTGTISRIKQEHDNETSEFIQCVQYEKIIIDAVPIKIIKYENPTSIEIKYEIEFQTPTGQLLKFQPANLDEILSYLKLNGLVYKVRAAEEALPAILNAYYREGKVAVKREIETPGFYLINNRIETYKTEHKQPTAEEIRICADLLQSMQLKRKRKEILPTILKWGIIAPFSYILKQLDGEKWMPWPYLYGWTNTGKTTNGRIALAIWRRHKDKTKHDIGFSSTDNVARFGRAISYNTYPVLINEVQLNDDRQKQLVEALKHAVQSQTARSRLISRSVTENISALSPCILTSNDLPPQDPAFKRRIIPIYYSKEDEPSQEEIEQFHLLLGTGLDTLGTLGDFTANFILENQDLLVNNKSSWMDAAKYILAEFFKAAGKEVPDWIEYFVPESEVQDAALEQEQIIRGFFVKTINDAFTRNYRALMPREDIDEVIHESTIGRRLEFCCHKELIPFLRKKDDCILILHDIMHELKSHRINSIIHLTQLARMFQSEYKSIKLNGTTYRLVSIPVSKFLEFISPAISL